jgi:proline iminopeptidase
MALLMTVAGLLPAHAAGHKERPARDALPRQFDWFLSTGDWHKDPQLYVREFGTGDETVVVLHGGWGAEHSGLVDAVRLHALVAQRLEGLTSPSGTRAY